MSDVKEPRRFILIERKHSVGGTWLPYGSTYYDAASKSFVAVEASSYDAANAEIEKYKEVEHQRLENGGCCFVEHGWRISAEHEVKDLRSKLAAANAKLEVAVAALEKVSKVLHWD